MEFKLIFDIWAVRLILIHLSFALWLFFLSYPSIFLFLSPSLCRELNDINRKHIQDSVTLIRRVSTHFNTVTHTPFQPWVCPFFYLIVYFSAIVINPSQTLSSFSFLPSLLISLNPPVPSFNPHTFFMYLFPLKPSIRPLTLFILSIPLFIYSLPPLTPQIFRTCPHFLPKSFLPSHLSHSSWRRLRPGDRTRWCWDSGKCCST